MSTKLAQLSLVTLVLGIGTLAFAGGQPEKPKVEGMWLATTAEHNGKIMPEELVDGTKFRVDGEKLVAVAKNGKEFLSSTYVLNPSKKPCEISLKLTGGKDAKTLEGLVERRGDELRIIYALPGGEKPTAFKTKDKQVMYTLRLQKLVQ